MAICARHVSGSHDPKGGQIDGSGVIVPLSVAAVTVRDQAVRHWGVAGGHCGGDLGGRQHPDQTLLTEAAAGVETSGFGFLIEPMIRCPGYAPARAGH